MSSNYGVSCTGIGTISPLGNSLDILFEKLMTGQSGIRLLSSSESNGIPTVAGCAEFEPLNWFSKLQLSGVDRISQLAVAAAELAKTDANFSTYHPENIGCYFGTGMGGASAMEQAYISHCSSQPRISPLTVIATMCNAAAAHIAMRFQIQGPVLTYSVACSSSSVAIGEACRAIASGAIDCAFVGGAEALLVPGVIRAWQAMRTLARPDLERPETSCRPFATDRSGLVLAEGATALILERTDLAKARGARIYADVIGYGLSCDANHIAKPNQAGQVRAMKSALREANLSPLDVGYINAHGTATQVGDVVESAAIREVWQDHFGDLKVSSTKSMHGHLLGAAGALESAITILSLYRQEIPPTAFCHLPDPEISLPLVLNHGHGAPGLKFALSNSFAFGGTNVTLAFRRHSF